MAKQNTPTPKTFAEMTPDEQAAYVTSLEQSKSASDAAISEAQSKHSELESKMNTISADAEKAKKANASLMTKLQKVSDANDELEELNSELSAAIKKAPEDLIDTSVDIEGTTYDFEPKTFTIVRESKSKDPRQSNGSSSELIDVVALVRENSKESLAKLDEVAEHLYVINSGILVEKN